MALPITMQPEGARADVEVLADPDLLHCNQDVLIVGVGVPRHVPALILSSVPTTGAAPILGSEVILALAGCAIVTLPLTGEAA